MPAPTPERFDDYERVKRLGVGEMAETFLAIRRGAGGFEQRVCPKRILPAFADDADFVKMFLRDARLPALLNFAEGDLQRCAVGKDAESVANLNSCEV